MNDIIVFAIFSIWAFFIFKKGGCCGSPKIKGKDDRSCCSIDNKK